MAGPSRAMTQKQWPPPFFATAVMNDPLPELGRRLIVVPDSARAGHLSVLEQMCAIARCKAATMA
jgi:hypothetical protein